MKTLILFFIFFIPAQIFCQSNLKKKDASRVIDEKIIIELTEDDSVNSYLTRAVNNYWTINDNYTFRSEVNQSNNPVILCNMHTLIKRVDHYGLTSITDLGFALKMSLNIDGTYWSVGFNSQSTFTYYDFVEAIKRFQFFLAEIIDEGSWNSAYKATKKKYGKELETITLLVDKDILKKSLSFSKFQSIYPYECKLVSKKEIEQAVLENDESKAYISIVEEKVGVYVQYICNAGTGKIYSHKHSAYQSDSARKSKSFNDEISSSDLKKLSSKIK